MAEDFRLDPAFVATSHKIADLPLCEARLQDDVAPASWPTMRAVLESELGPERLARFTHIDETPLAAASVAQVHVGTLDTGEKVAIKIQRPEARAQIERDLFLMRAIANALDRIPQLRLLSIPGSVERFGEALSNQLDFTLEAFVNLWDLAPVQLIVEEAGGRFTDFDGVARPDGGSGISSNGLLHDEVLAALAR